MSEENYSETRSPILKAENVYRTVSNGTSTRAIISDFSFEFAGGEIFTILGPSGAGKSSLLRLFNRLDEATGGTIYFEGEDIRGINPCGLRRKIGYLFQTPHMFPGTVKENLLYTDPSLSDDAMISMLDEVNLAPDIIETNAEVLSVGERQRVAMARLFALQPEILLLDEPTSALDEKNSALIIRLIKKKISHDGITAIIVMHNPGQAAAFRGTALLLMNGRMVEHGPVDELIHSPSTKEGKSFLESDNI